MILTKLQEWLLKRICRKLVRQGPLHEKRITAYYRIMYIAALEEFTEESPIGLGGFLNGCFAGSQPLYSEAMRCYWAMDDLLKNKEKLPLLLGISSRLDNMIHERLSNEKDL